MAKPITYPAIHTRDELPKVKQFHQLPQNQPSEPANHTTKDSLFQILRSNPNVMYDQQIQRAFTHLDIHWDNCFRDIHGDWDIIYPRLKSEAAEREIAKAIAWKQQKAA